jgi:hypothetical protein
LALSQFLSGRADDENAREDSIIDLEIERINNFVIKYRAMADEMLDNIIKLKEKFR